MEGELGEVQEAHPAWEITVMKVSARWLGSSPPIRVTGTTLAGLAAKMRAAEDTWYRTYSWQAVMDAIGQEET